MIHIFHRWGNWKQEEIPTRGYSGEVYYPEFNIRHCLKCGKKQIKRVYP